MSALLSELLTTDDLARIMRKSVHTIRHDLTRNPRSLPPRCAIPGTNRNLWRPQDVDAWLASLVITPDPDPLQCPAKPKSKRGAPTKAERVRRQQATKLSMGGKA
jgi:hypothetical protein